MKKVTPDGIIWLHQGDIEGYQAGFIYDVNSNTVITGTRNLNHVLTPILGEEGIVDFMQNEILPYLKQQQK